MRFVDFFYIWIPAVLIGTLVILTLPWLALIALGAALLAAVAALGSLIWAIVAALSALGHSILGQSHAWNPSETARQHASH